MAFIIKGNLLGYLCDDCFEAVSEVQIRIYSPESERDITAAAVAATKDTFRSLTKKQVEAKSNRLIAEGKTDQAGNFEIAIGGNYTGGAFDIDFYCGNVPRFPPKPKLNLEPRQFHLTTVFPQWRQVGGTNEAVAAGAEDYIFGWQYALSTKIWCFIRGYYFDAWTICGHLTNCQTQQPLEGVEVFGYDADLIQDDTLGSAITDAAGHFRIDYTSSDFRKNFLFQLNLETDIDAPFFSSGPDVYFKAFYNGTPILEETSANRRKNVGYCLCVRLCSTKNIVPEGGGNLRSAWTSIGLAFNIPTGSILNDFDTEGYAGAAKYGFTSTIRLTGQAPHKRANGNRVEYRFLVSHTTTPNGGAAPALANFTKIIGVTSGLFASSLVGKLSQSIFPFATLNVFSQQADFDTEGWFDVNKAIERTLTDNSIPLSDLPNWDYIDEDTLLSLNTAALTTAPDVPNGAATAGNPVPVGNRIGIEKIAIRFEVREVVNKATNSFVTLLGSGQTLNSMVVNNNPTFFKCVVDELVTLGDCSPLSGDIHTSYTVHHPLLKDVSIHVRSNSGVINKYLSDGFITLSNNTNSAVNHRNTAALKINATPNDLIRCTYLLTYSSTRRLHTGDGADSANPQNIVFFYE